MTKKYQLNIFLIFLLLVSCTRKNKLSSKDFEWMPYRGNETLVFSSNKGETDTIFFLKKDTIIAYPEAQNPFGTTYEEVVIFCKHTDPWPPDGKHRYVENSFIELGKSEDGVTRLNINLSAKNAVFYQLQGTKIDSIESINPIRLNTKYYNYRDVYIIYPIDYLNREKDGDYVTKLYWSRSEGLVRFDKNDQEFWELKKKYSP